MITVEPSVTSPIPVLTSARLVLRPFNLGDAKEVQRMAGDEKVAATTATVPHPYLDGMAERWISQHATWATDGGGITWAITEKQSGRLVGCIDFCSISRGNRKAEVGYWMGVEYWGQGYCTEAFKALVDFGFRKLNLNKITCRHMDINPASGRVMQKAGLTKEATLRQDMIKNGRVCDIEVYAILRQDYVASRV